MRDDTDLPNVAAELFDCPDRARVEAGERLMHPPRFLLLYGSLRERSYSRLLVEEAGRLLSRMGGEVRMFDPRGLPLPDGAPKDHPKVAELRSLSMWSEGQVWCSPERHGAISGVFKSQIDWLPAERGRRAADPGAHAGGDAGERRLAIVQRRQQPARARPLDADGHDPEPVLGAQGLRGVRRGRADEAVAATTTASST